MAKRYEISDEAWDVSRISSPQPTPEANREQVIA